MGGDRREEQVLISVLSSFLHSVGLYNFEQGSKLDKVTTHKDMILKLLAWKKEKNEPGTSNN